MEQHVIFTAHEIAQLQNGEEIVLDYINPIDRKQPSKIVFTMENKESTLLEQELLNLKHGKITVNEIRKNHGFPPNPDLSDVLVCVIKEKGEKIMNYFILHLKNGEIFDFDKKCKYLIHVDQPMVTFANQEKNYEVLMIVPASEILYIESSVLQGGNNVII